MKDLSRHLEKLGPFTLEPLTKNDNAEFNRLMCQFREMAGFQPLKGELLTRDTDNAKLAKSNAHSVGLSLAPAGTSGNWNTCRHSSQGCRDLCLATAGNGRYPKSQLARNWRTELLAAHPALFLRKLADLLRVEVKKHGKINFRFNIISDLRVEIFCPDLLTLKGVNAYDYTKYPSEKRTTSDRYKLVGSVHENHTRTQISNMVEAYGSVAVVINRRKNEPFPATWLGYKIVDGDLSDDRTQSNETKTIIGLRPKGKAIGTDSKFVRELA
jgi:hypothetical protein